MYCGPVVRPVLGRNDHGLHNLLVDPETGSVTAMLDWAYTLAVAPAYDFEFAVYLFSGAFMAGLGNVRDRRELVRGAMIAGYTETNPSGADSATGGEPVYEVLAMVRIMNDFDQLEPRLPEEGVAPVSEQIRADVHTLIEGRD